MGYDVHITRKANWFDDDPKISLSQWLELVALDPELHLDGFTQTALPNGGTLQAELAVWIAYSRHGDNGNMAWFAHLDGDVVVKNPDKEILVKMWGLAQALGARVQGDELETYDALGNVERPSAALAPAAPDKPVNALGAKPWWPFGRRP